MEHITKIEAAWIADALAEKSRACERAANMKLADSTKLDKGMYKLRAEQYAGLAERLRKAVENGDKRIAIDY